jgi:hypothetical protein
MKFSQTSKKKNNRSVYINPKVTFFLQREWSYVPMILYNSVQQVWAGCNWSRRAMCYCLDGSAAPPQPTRAARVDSSSRLPEKGSGLSVGQDRQRASTRNTACGSRSELLCLCWPSPETDSPGRLAFLEILHTELRLRQPATASA